MRSRSVSFALAVALVAAAGLVTGTVLHYGRAADSARKDLAEARAAESSARRDADASSRELAARRAEVEKLQGELRDRTSACAELEEKLQRQVQVAQEAQARMDELAAENDRLTRAQADLEAKLKAAEAERSPNAPAAERLRTLEAEVLRLRLELDLLRPPGASGPPPSLPPGATSAPPASPAPASPEPSPTGPAGPPRAARVVPVERGSLWSFGNIRVRVEPLKHVEGDPYDWLDGIVTVEDDRPGGGGRPRRGRIFVEVEFLDADGRRMSFTLVERGGVVAGREVSFRASVRPNPRPSAYRVTGVQFSE